MPPEEHRDPRLPRVVVDLLLPLARDQRVGAGRRGLVEPVDAGARDDRDALDLVGPEVDHARRRLLAVGLPLEPVERLPDRRGRERLRQLPRRPDRDRADLAERLAVFEADRLRDAGRVAEVGVAVQREVRDVQRDVALDQRLDPVVRPPGDAVEAPPRDPVVNDEDVGARVGRGLDRRLGGVDRDGDALDLGVVRSDL